MGYSLLRTSSSVKQQEKKRNKMKFAIVMLMLGVASARIVERQDDPAPADSPADMCAQKINEEMRVIEETLTRCAEEGHSGPAFDYCVLGICGTQFTAGYTVCQQARFWRMARDCDTRVCLVDLRKFWLTAPTPNGFQLPTGNGEGWWRWVPYGEE